jgi:DNA-directed RNA polymerase specialized sigma24 family protein
VESPDFAEFQSAVCAGDLPAAMVLLRRLEPALRTVIRLYLCDGRLRRWLDTSDVWQSVLADYIHRLSVGTDPAAATDHVWAYLACMVRNKVVTKARRLAHAPEPLPDGYDHPETGPSPPDVVADRLLIAAIRDRLPPAERDLLDQLARGHTWPEIAAAAGCEPDTLRMRLRRAVAKVRLGESGGSRGR